MPRSRVTNPAASGGFTLVELMVSITILVVIVAMLTGIFNETTKAWTATEGGNERRRGARLLTDLIGAELRSATIPVDSFPVSTGTASAWSSTSGRGNLQFVINPANISPEYLNPHAIFWQAPIATDKSLGDLAEVGYFVKWEQSQSGSSALPSLRRFFVNPSIAVAGKEGFTQNPDFLIYDTDPLAWLTTSLIDKVASARKEDGYPGLVAENVVGFWVERFGSGGSTFKQRSSWTAFDSRHAYTDTVTAESRFLPREVAISIAQVDLRASARLGPAWRKVQLLANSGDSTNADKFLDRFRAAADADGELRALLPNLRIYSTRVMMENSH